MHGIMFDFYLGLPHVCLYVNECFYVYLQREGCVYMRMSLCGREWGGERWGWGVGGEGEERGKDLAIKNWALGRPRN